MKSYTQIILATTFAASTSAVMVQRAPVVALAQEADPYTCWKATVTRGVGRPIHSCPDGEENDAGLCYPHCDEGYYGVGPVCWQYCPDGFRDDGAFCAKPDIFKGCQNGQADWGVTCAKNTYGRGVGKFPGCGSNEDMDAGLCYDKCPAGYSGHGPVCWKECPAGTSTCGALC